MRKEIKLLIMVICAIVTIPLLTACGDDDEPTYLYSYWESLKAIRVLPSQTSVEITPMAQGDGVVLSPNESDLEDFESLALVKLWSLDSLDPATEYTIGEVRCKWGWNSFTFDNLTPNKTYYYRVITMATSTVGDEITEYKIVYGDIYSFKTTSED